MADDETKVQKRKAVEEEKLSCAKAQNRGDANESSGDSGDEDERPGVFFLEKPSHYNDRFYTFDSFVVVAENKRMAQHTHPDSKNFGSGFVDSFEYTCGEAERQESWKKLYPGEGPAPGWFLDENNSCLLYTSPSPRD